MKKIIFLSFLLILSTRIFAEEDFDLGFGLNIPLVKDKTFISVEADFYYKFMGAYFDIGFMMNNREVKEFDDKQLLGWFTDFEVFKQVNINENLALKAGVGVSYYNLANIDNKKWYIALPLSATVEYKIKNTKLFYRLQVPIVKSSDLEYTDNLLGNIGIGVCF